MKKIIINLVVLALVFSCSNDDSSRFVVNPQLPIQEATLTADRSASFAGDLVNFTFTLPSSFPNAGVLEVTASNNSNNVSRATVNVPAGSTTGSGTIIMPASNSNSLTYEGSPDFATLQITGVQNEDGSQTGSDVTSNVVALDYLNFSFTNASGLSVGLDWEGDTSIDIDYAMFRTTGPFSGLNAGTSNKPEVNDIDSDELADGDYLVLYRSFTNVTGPIQLRTVLRGDTSVGAQYLADFPSLPISGGWFAANVLANVSKSTDGDGNVTYTFSDPNM